MLKLFTVVLIFDVHMSGVRKFFVDIKSGYFKRFPGKGVKQPSRVFSEHLIQTQDIVMFLQWAAQEFLKEKK